MAVVKKISELTPKGSALANTDLLIVGVDNGTDYDLKSLTGAQVLGNVISQSITNGDTTHSPSSDVVFDALALKVDTVVGSRLITSAEATILSNTSGTNSGDETVTTIKTKLGITTLSGSNTGDQDLSNLATKSTPTFTGLATLDTLKVTTGNYITPVDVVGIDVTGNVNRVSAVNGRTALGLGTLATQSGTFSGTSSGTNTGDQIISDATITTTDITTNNFDTTKHGFVPKGTNVGNFLKDDGTWGTPASGSSGGTWGIANSSGVYTYYATWALAVAAAVSGQVIELFADITISSGTLTLKDGVNIQGNGHTLTLNTGTHGFIDNAVTVNVIINNIVLYKTDAVDAGIINLTNSSSKVGGNATINVGNATPQGILGSGNVWGFRIIGNGYPILINGGNPIIENIYINTTFSGYAVQYQNTPVMQVNNCLIKSTGNGIKTLGDINNCNIVVSGIGVLIAGTGSINNINCKSSTSNAIQAGNNSIENSTFISNGNVCVSFTSSTRAYNSYFYSNAEVVIVGAGNFYNCTLKTDIYYVTQGFTGQCIDCELINNYNNVIGRIAHEPLGASYINCNMIVANSSVVPIYSASTPTVYLYGNSIKGTTNLKSAGVVNGQTNTADAQGNVILN